MKKLYVTIAVCSVFVLSMYFGMTRFAFAESNKRFNKVHEESFGMDGGFWVFEDTQTGVKYLAWKKNNSGGICKLEEK